MTTIHNEANSGRHAPPTTHHGNDHHRPVSFFWPFLVLLIYHLFYVSTTTSSQSAAAVADITAATIATDGVAGSSFISSLPSSSSFGEENNPNENMEERRQRHVQQIDRQLHEFLPKDPSEALRGNHSCVRMNMTYIIPKIPAFIIIGTQKGGTSALAALLDHHPWLESSHYFEPHFFDQNKMMLYYKKRLDEPEAMCKVLRHYVQKNFNLKRLWKYPNLQTFEKTPAYILTPNAPARIKAVVPWSKIIVILRNPVKRLVSQHKMLVMRNWENESFAESLAYDINLMRHLGYWVPSDDPFQSRFLGTPTSSDLRTYKTDGMLYRGCYAHQLMPWLEQFDYGTQLLALRYEELRDHPKDVLRRVQAFVGAPYYDFPKDALGKSYSPTGDSWKTEYDPDVSEESIDYLKRFYKPYNDELADLLGEEWRGVWDD